MRPNLTHTLNPNLKALLLSGLRLKEVIKIRITIKNPYLPLKSLSDLVIDPNLVCVNLPSCLHNS